MELNYVAIVVAAVLQFVVGGRVVHADIWESLGNDAWV